jgi:hypothetical protein|tara:strand:- start:2987 stop:3115 length:129 start_codon:yes stop_codon:yes gene_type:complete
LVNSFLTLSDFQGSQAVLAGKPKPAAKTAKKLFALKIHGRAD